MLELTLFVFFTVCCSSEDLTSTTIFFLSSIEPNYYQLLKRKTYFFETGLLLACRLVGAHFPVHKHLFHDFFFLFLLALQVRVPGEEVVFAKTHHVTLHPIDLVLLELLLNFALTDLFIRVLDYLAFLAEHYFWFGVRLLHSVFESFQFLFGSVVHVIVVDITSFPLTIISHEY